MICVEFIGTAEAVPLSEAVRALLECAFVLRYEWAPATGLVSGALSCCVGESGGLRIHPANPCLRSETWGTRYGFLGSPFEALRLLRVSRNDKVCGGVFGEVFGV